MRVLSIEAAGRASGRDRYVNTPREELAVRFLRRAANQWLLACLAGFPALPGGVLLPTLPGGVLLPVFPLGAVFPTRPGGSPPWPGGMPPCPGGQPPGPLPWPGNVQGPAAGGAGAGAGLAAGGGFGGFTFGAGWFGLGCGLTGVCAAGRACPRGPDGP